MKALIILFLTFVFTCHSINGQNSVLSKPAIFKGQVIDRITDKPLKNVLIIISKRVWDIMPDGLPSLHPASELISTEISLSTNRNGAYKKRIKLSSSKEYYLIHVFAEGFEPLEYTLVVLESGKTTTINLELIKLNPTPEEQKILDEKEKQDLKKKNDKKIEDYNNINFLQQNPPPKTNKSNQTVKDSGENQNIITNCSYNVPSSFYVYNLSSGYNSYSCPPSGFTGYIPQSEFVGGCIAGEMGGSFPTEALKAQSVAARTYALKRINTGSGANCGQAYSFTVCSSCTTSANVTNNQVLLYNGGLIEALYSARCGGSYTHTASPTSCYGFNAFPYLVCVSCSGHSNCSSNGEPCTNCFNACLNTNVDIYGHGVGLCQRGAQDFASSYSYDWILDHFYGGGGVVCLANVNITCTPPDVANLTFGADSCSGTLIYDTLSSNTVLSWDTVSGATGYKVYVSRYPYGSSCLLTGYNPYPCSNYSGQIVLSSALEKGMLYRWNMYATSDCSNSICDGMLSSSKYFYVPPEVLPSTSQTICNGSGVTFSASAANVCSGGSVSYQWYLNGSPIYGATDTSYNATQAGNYYIQFNFSGSSYCSSASIQSNSVLVSINQAPSQPDSISGIKILCQGIVQTYTVSPVLNAISYSWTLPSGWTGNSSSNSITVISGSTGGAISVTANDSSCSSSPSSLNVIVNPLPDSAVIIGSISSPAQYSNVSYTANSNYASSFNWAIPTGWTINSGIGTSTIDITVGASSGSLCVTPSNTCGNGTQTCINVYLAGILNYGNSDNINIYPNPANDIINIEFEIVNYHKMILFTIFNCIGQEVLTDKINNTQGKVLKVLDVKSLNNGIYLMQIKLNDGTTLNKKIAIK